jgi:hypothetical protein
VTDRQRDIPHLYLGTFILVKEMPPPPCCTIEYVFNSFLLPPGTSDDSSRFCLKFWSLSNVLFTCKPWRGRPPEPWPTTALHPTPSPYKHIGRLPLLTTFIGGLRGVLGATISLCQTIASSTVHLWAHLMHRWTNGHNLGLFNRCKPPNNSLGWGYYQNFVFVSVKSNFAPT